MCEFNDPYGIASDLHGFIIVADTNNHRVSIFDKHMVVAFIALAPKDLLMISLIVLVE